MEGTCWRALPLLFEAAACHVLAIRAHKCSATLGLKTERTCRRQESSSYQQQSEADFKDPFKRLSKAEPILKSALHLTPLPSLSSGFSHAWQAWSLCSQALLCPCVLYPSWAVGQA